MDGAPIRRLLADGWWRALSRGIYHTSPAEPSWDGWAWSGLLIGGHGSRLGPRASGYLHGLLDNPPKPVDVLVPMGRSTRIDGPWQFSRERPGARTHRTVGALAHLCVEDTVLDLVGALGEGDVVGLVTRATQRRRTSPSAILRTMAERSRQPHRELLQHLLADVSEGVESPLELRYLRNVERPHALPRGNRQRRRLGLPYVSDVGYDEFCLLVELDGRKGHDGEGRFRDLDRDNRFALASWLTLRYGWFDVVNRPCQVAFQVASVLAQRGWAGIAQRCPSCRLAPDEDLLQ